MSAEREADRAALLAEVDRHEVAGLRIPCRFGPLAHTARWTSDDDRAQALAAAACDGCPALDSCHAYGAAHPREAGVYGGRTEHDRWGQADRARRAAAARARRAQEGTAA